MFWRLSAIPATLGVLASALIPTAQAQDVTGCAVIQSDALRLACYDRRAQQGTGNTPAQDSTGAAVAVAPDAMAALDVSTPADKGLLDRRWELDPDSKLGLFQLRAYKPVYVLPAFWSSKPNERPTSPNPANTAATAQPLDSVEAKFQLGFKTKLAQNLIGDNVDLWLGYTQTSRWQAYNEEISRPFRETNYEPELMAVARTPTWSVGGWKTRLLAVSLNHQSNGRADPLSRSWNRVILAAGADREHWAVIVRPWFRIKEDFVDDNNPDIEDYMGRGDATLIYTRNGHEVSMTARHSLRGGDRNHGSAQVNWAFPITRGLNGHLQIFSGYGESLIDYNHRATYVGLGVSLLEWL